VSACLTGLTELFLAPERLQLEIEQYDENIDMMTTKLLRQPIKDRM